MISDTVRDGNQYDERTLHGTAIGHDQWYGYG